MAKEAYFYGERGLLAAPTLSSHRVDPNETYLHGNRGLLIWQVRPIYSTNSVVLSSLEWILKRPIYITKEAYLYGK